jgi:hypothetical protein
LSINLDWFALYGHIAQSTSQLKESFELNFFAHQYVASAAVKVFMMQNVGSCFMKNRGNSLLFF